MMKPISYRGEREQDAHEAGIFSMIGGIAVMALLMFGAMGLGFKVLLIFVPLIFVLMFYLVARQISRSDYDWRLRQRQKQRKDDTVEKDE